MITASVMKELKAILDWCKLRVVLKSKTTLSNTSICIPKDLRPSVVFEIECEFCIEYYHGEYVRHLNLKHGQQFHRSSLKSSLVSHHVLFCNHYLSLYDFGVLTYAIGMYLLQLNEISLIMKHRPFLKRNITAAPLHLLDMP